MGSLWVVQRISRFNMAKNILCVFTTTYGQVHLNEHRWEKKIKKYTRVYIFSGDLISDFEALKHYVQKTTAWSWHKYITKAIQQLPFAVFTYFVTILLFIIMNIKSIKSLITSQILLKIHDKVNSFGIDNNIFRLPKMSTLEKFLGLSLWMKHAGCLSNF